MKKIVVSALAVLFVLNVANAQENKPLQGNVTADLGIFTEGIFNATKSPVSALDGVLKGRYFIMDAMAIRASFGLNTQTTKDTSVKDVVTTDNRNSLHIGAGVEKHFEGTDRLSPYVGADLYIQSTTRKNTVDHLTDNNLDVITKAAPVFGLGARLLFGADYYIAQHVYMGVEAGLDLQSTSVGRSSVTINGKTTTSEKVGSNFGLASNVFAGFKLGFAF
ncbi:MAG: BT1926 family outer membrane beta-barrel protein [Porphyromonadaceae bacterium]|nr:BT1926 family outer membrane beta-barrel protein [Porphyromonadaceae bacterium]